LKIINHHFSALQSRIECPHSPVALLLLGNDRQARRGDEGCKEGRGGRGTRCCHTATSCFCGRFSWTREVYNGAQRGAADGGGVALAHQCGQRYLLPLSRPLITHQRLRLLSSCPAHGAMAMHLSILQPRRRASWCCHSLPGLNARAQHRCNKS
jgi:hypothetical protein